MPEILYPPPAFYFTVSFNGGTNDASFQEVSGLKVELQTETVVEGGQNRFEHHLPTRTKYTNLVLKRGLVTANSPLANWLEGCFSNDPSMGIFPVDLVVMLLDQKAAPLVSWNLTGAYPLRWEHSALQAEENKLMIETIELSYHYFDRKTY